MRDRRSQEQGKVQRKGKEDDGEKIGREGGEGGRTRRGKMRQQESEQEAEGSRKRERGEDDTHKEHLILGLCLALTTGKECFRLNHKKLPYWKQIHVVQVDRVQPVFLLTSQDSATSQPQQMALATALALRCFLSLHDTSLPGPLNDTRTWED